MDYSGRWRLRCSDRGIAKDWIFFIRRRWCSCIHQRSSRQWLLFRLCRWWWLGRLLLLLSLSNNLLVDTSVGLLKVSIAHGSKVVADKRTRSVSYRGSSPPLTEWRLFHWSVRVREASYSTGHNHPWPTTKMPNEKKDQPTIGSTSSLMYEHTGHRSWPSLIEISSAATILE